MVLWLNGTFGSGKTTTALELLPLIASSRLFDPETVGYMLQPNLCDHPVSDFQHWPLWRPLVLAGAIVMHAGIGLCLGMWTFGLIMLVGCASFLPNEAVRRLVGARDRHGAGLTPTDGPALRPTQGASRIGHTRVRTELQGLRPPASVHR